MKWFRQLHPLGGSAEKIMTKHKISLPQEFCSQFRGILGQKHTQGFPLHFKFWYIVRNAQVRRQEFCQCLKSENGGPQKQDGKNVLRSFTPPHHLGVQLAPTPRKFSLCECVTILGEVIVSL